jgi:hypothetical protein
MIVFLPSNQLIKTLINSFLVQARYLVQDFINLTKYLTIQNKLYKWNKCATHRIYTIYI